MNTLQFLFIAAFFVLLIPERSRVAAFFILINHVIYALLILDLPGESYYHFAALLNLITGLIIINRYFLVGITSFLLIPINFFGFILYEKYYDPALYDNMSLTIIAIQIILLTMRSLHGVLSGYVGAGLFINFIRLLMVRIIDIDSIQENRKTNKGKK